MRIHVWISVCESRLPYPRWTVIPIFIIRIRLRSRWHFKVVHVHVQVCAGRPGSWPDRRNLFSRVFLRGLEELVRSIFLRGNRCRNMFFFFVVRVNISQQKQIRLFVKRVSLTRKTQSFFKTLSAFFLVPYKRVLESISNFSCIFPLSPLLNARVTELVNPLSRVAQKNDENCLSITN